MFLVAILFFLLILIKDLLFALRDSKHISFIIVLFIFRNSFVIVSFLSNNKCIAFIIVILYVSAITLL